jgi:plasmid stabilization system protein ParE
MRKLIWMPAADRDLDRIDAWLEQEASAETSIKILLAIRERANRLIDFPHAGPALRDQGFRKLLVLGTPYIIAYRIEPQAVQILRVHHEHENWRAIR